MVNTFFFFYLQIFVRFWPKYAFECFTIAVTDIISVFQSVQTFRALEHLNYRVYFHFSKWAFVIRLTLIGVCFNPFIVLRCPRPTLPVLASLTILGFYPTSTIFPVCHPISDVTPKSEENPRILQEPSPKTVIPSSCPFCTQISSSFSAAFFILTSLTDPVAIEIESTKLS